jgi:transcriptional regulator with PAS, ATPase and Fis domain
MTSSILWIGDIDGIATDVLAEDPSLELVWSPDLQDALDLPLERFTLVVMDRPGEHDGNLTSLRAAGARQVWSLQDRDTVELRDTLRQLGVPAPVPGGAASASASPVPGVIGRSAGIRGVFHLVEKAQATAATVLLGGETGTGKEILARAVHDGSDRSEGPYVALNCAAFPDTLLESELFGHDKGSFTGADRAKEGLFAAADGGTLFLDEVGETSIPLQAKLLRVLQEREVRPVGGNRARRIDVRVIAATNRDLRREVEAGTFRADLYYRLAVFPIRVPPLRERRDDILPLAEHFLVLHGRRERKPGCKLDPEAERWLASHRWPGNVRELENEMQRALALSDLGDTIGVARLSQGVADLREPAELLVRDDEPLKATVQRFEAWLLRRALARNGGQKAATARALGLTREGLYKKLKRLGIE